MKLFDAPGRGSGSPPASKSRPRAVLFAAAVAILGVSACSPAQSADVSPAAVRPGDLTAADVAKPPPAKDIVLSLSGAVSLRNTEARLDLDLSAIERLPLVESELYEPFMKQKAVYRGPLVSELLKFAGASRSATTVHFVALDDYEVTIPTEVLRSEPVILASHENGKAIGVDNGGPIRLVFPSGAAYGKNTDAWIWNVRTMEAR